MDSMYEILKGLPLFHGATTDRISDIVEKTKFHFLKYLAGERIITAGEQCTHVKIIISGKVSSSISNANERFKVTQTLSSPSVIAPEFLFGRATNYPCTVEAIEDTSILQISKNDYITILNRDKIFLYNFLNMLSLSAQKSIDGVLALASGDLEERIAFWIVALSQYGGTDIKISCRQRDLYSLFGVQRSSFIATLESMNQRGLIDYNQNEIIALSRPDLVKMVRNL